MAQSEEAEVVEEIHRPSRSELTCLIPAWQCNVCQRECIPVRSESRCLCGHRLKQHAQSAEAKNGPYRCTAKGCECPSFFYIVAEGSWILRCTCKHRHTDHSPTDHACRKKGCACTRFLSPWVCNCNHKWSDHDMLLKSKFLGAKCMKFARDARANPAMVAADTAILQSQALDQISRGEDAVARDILPA